jgi:hypothetical protein
LRDVWVTKTASPAQALLVPSLTQRGALRRASLLTPLNTRIAMLPDERAVASLRVPLEPISVGSARAMTDDYGHRMDVWSPKTPCPTDDYGNAMEPYDDWIALRFPPGSVHQRINASYRLAIDID